MGPNLAQDWRDNKLFLAGENSFNGVSCVCMTDLSMDRRTATLPTLLMATCFRTSLLTSSLYCNIMMMMPQNFLNLLLVSIVNINISHLLCCKFSFGNWKQIAGYISYFWLLLITCKMCCVPEDSDDNAALSTNANIYSCRCHLMWYKHCMTIHLSTCLSPAPVLKEATVFICCGEQYIFCTNLS